MKRFTVLLLTLLLLGSLIPAGIAAAPTLEDVLPSDDVLFPGDVLTISFVASEAGTINLKLYHNDQAPEGIAIASQSASAGQGKVTWDGAVPGAETAAGEWRVSLSLTNQSGETSGEYLVWVAVANETAQVAAAEPATVEETPEPRPTASPRPYTPLTNHPVEGADNYWHMDIYNFDIEDPATQQKMWEYMMQPIVVLDTHPTEHIYMLTEPGADGKLAANVTGQLHGTTQGVNIIRQEGDWTLVEAYTNDGYRALNEKMINKLFGIAGTLVEGWVPTSKLKTVETNQTIGLVIDKLHQKMYIFENGVMTGELLVSTGKPSKNNPNLETPAGEFITDSWVGLFESFGMACDLAIRINGGVLIHEVPHEILGDGSRRYTKFEQYLGQKASHGCIRTQRVKNDQGQNMTWLWDNLKKKAKVLIIDDAGRYLPPPDMNLTLYYNPDGGKYYHADQNCPSIKDRFLPLPGVMTYGDLFSGVSPFDKLTPCATCTPPVKIDESEIPEDIVGVGEDAGAETTQEVDPEEYGQEEYTVDE